MPRGTEPEWMAISADLPRPLVWLIALAVETGAGPPHVGHPSSPSPKLLRSPVSDFTRQEVEDRNVAGCGNRIGLLATAKVRYLASLAKWPSATISGRDKVLVW